MHSRSLRTAFVGLRYRVPAQELVQIYLGDFFDDRQSLGSRERTIAEICRSYRRKRSALQSDQGMIGGAARLAMLLVHAVDLLDGLVTDDRRNRAQASDSCRWVGAERLETTRTHVDDLLTAALYGMVSEQAIQLLDGQHAHLSVDSNENGALGGHAIPIQHLIPRPLNLLDGALDRLARERRDGVAEVEREESARR